MRSGESPSCSSDRQSRWRTSITMACRDQLWPCRRLLPPHPPVVHRIFRGHGGWGMFVRDSGAVVFLWCVRFLNVKTNGPIPSYLSSYPCLTPHAQFLIGWQTALPTSQKSHVNPCELVWYCKRDRSLYECFYKLYSRIGTEGWFTVMCPFASKGEISCVLC